MNYFLTFRFSAHLRDCKSNTFFYSVQELFSKIYLFLNSAIVQGFKNNTFFYSVQEKKLFLRTYFRFRKSLKNVSEKSHLAELSKVTLFFILTKFYFQILKIYFSKFSMNIFWKT